MSKIRIAYIIDKLDIGGTERQLKYLIEGLDNSKFEIFLYLLRGTMDHPMRPNGVETKLLGVDSLLSVNGIRKLLQLSNQLKKDNIHILQTFFQDATVFGVIAAKMAKIDKIVVSIRDMLFWATPGNSWAHRIATSMTDVILVNSKAVKKRVGSYVKNVPIEVIYNGIPDENIISKNNSVKQDLVDELGIGIGIPIVTLVSNCNRSVKRVDVFVDSIPFIVKKANAFFLVVGNGCLRKSLEKRVEKLRISEYIRFLGQRDDVERILAGSNMAVNTSDSEGFSNAILEAMRTGLPVIASDVPGNKELVDHNKNGLHFRSGNYKDLSEKLIYLIENEGISRSMGRIGRKKTASKFSLEDVVQAHQELYKSLMLLDRYIEELPVD
jgi:glycosyltransferase involved in cell wall biosynthesis